MANDQSIAGGSLGEKAIQHLMLRLHISRDELLENYVYCGGARDSRQSHANYFLLFFDGDPPPYPDHEETCVCDHYIKENCYITDKRDKKNCLVVLGNCCIKRFIPASGRTCSECGDPHQNRRDNYCADCRENLKFNPVTFNVPFADRRTAEALGAKYNFRTKKWCADRPNVLFELRRRYDEYIPGEERQGVLHIYYDVHYDDHITAKELGARWDWEARRWYAPSEAVAYKMDEYWDRILEEDKTTIIFNVPIYDRERAKLLGAKFNPELKTWYADTKKAAAKMLQFWPMFDALMLKLPLVRVAFDVPFDDKEQAKMLGARWDNTALKWFAPSEEVAVLMDEFWSRHLPTAADMRP
jgi:hypothetical protein